MTIVILQTVKIKSVMEKTS